MTTHRAVRRRWLLASALALLLAAACSGEQAGASFNSLNVSGAEWGRGFSLRDPQGQLRTLDDFRGQVVMLFFGFTQCPDICPTALARVADVMQRLGPDAQRLQVLFVTIDPERDTPALLREYTRAFHPSFLGLYGDLPGTEAAAREFKVFYKKVPTGSSYTMDHTTLSYVFDAKGRLRLAVRHEQDAASVAADIRRLLKEQA